MKITAKQAAAILGFRGTSAVRRLIKEGKLTDLKVRKEGAQKHYPELDSKQVNELKKSGGLANRLSISRGQIRRHDPRRPLDVKVGHGAPTLIKGILESLQVLADKVDEIDAKVDSLIKMWQ